ncbi:MAG TPA: hypothetical protein VHC46_06940 [Thermodesulfobacteriota bacterium]|nr:hypothetical protein [Thermodesulfobacteriota bacterium]
MVRNTLIVILAGLLSVTSYLLYTNKNISVSLGGGKADCNTAAPVESREGAPPQGPAAVKTEATPNTPAPQGETSSEKVEEVESDEPQIHLDPTVGMSINYDQKITTSYKVIGPRKFSLLTENDETMVEIDLDTGNVKINPKYKVDDLTKEFWKSVGRKYPEVCFVE